MPASAWLASACARARANSKASRTTWSAICRLSFRNKASLGSFTSCCCTLNCLDHTMVWLRKGTISSVPVVEVPDVAAGGAGLVCAPAITATIKTTEMAKRGFRILRVAGLFTMNTFEIVREAKCRSMQYKYCRWGRRTFLMIDICTLESAGAEEVGQNDRIQWVENEQQKRVFR